MGVRVGPLPSPSCELEEGVRWRARRPYSGSLTMSTKRGGDVLLVDAVLVTNQSVCCIGLWGVTFSRKYFAGKSRVGRPVGPDELRRPQYVWVPALRSPDPRQRLRMPATTLGQTACTSRQKSQNNT